VTLDVRALHTGDLHTVATLHDAAFPNSALSRLGTEAVRRYYLWLLEGPHQATNLGAFDNGVLVGFMFGGLFNGALTGFLQRNRGYLARRVLTHPWLVATPLFRDRVALTLRLLMHRRSKTATPVAAPSGRNFGILAIAVRPGSQGTGVGKALMTRTEVIARADGFEQMQLSVARTNEQAIRFYEARGWSKVRDSANAWTGAMTRHLNA
jgi:ribosomal protein S18 acetylase RimI-like enzyme